MNWAKQPKDEYFVRAGLCYLATISTLIGIGILLYFHLHLFIAYLDIFAAIGFLLFALYYTRLHLQGVPYDG